MLKIDKDNALKLFIEAASKQAKFTEDGDYKNSNKQYDVIINVAKYLKRTNNLRELINLLDNEDVGVKIWAATYLLEENEEKALLTLRNISNQDIKQHSFTAKMVIEEWNGGTLSLQY